jgi:hypothetical protein
MAGRIALGFIAAVLLVFFGYAAGKLEQRDSMIPFRVVRVVPDSDLEAVTITGMSAPFTVLVCETRLNVTLPGELGRPGDIVYIPDPRQSSESTTVP